MTDPHLVAYVVNAVSNDTAEVVLTVAHRDVDDEWYDNHDMHVIPFWTQALSELCTLNDALHIEALDVPPIPPDWIDHIQRCADLFASKATAHKGSGLLASLGLSVAPQASAPTKPMRR